LHIKFAEINLRKGIGDRQKNHTLTLTLALHFFPATCTAFLGKVGMVVGITWTLILDPGRRTLDFASLDCTAWIQSRLQAMAWWRSH
jgi:hypothetical protein